MTCADPTTLMVFGTAALMIGAWIGLAIGILISGPKGEQ
jgi:hypothetical protein